MTKKKNFRPPRPTYSEGFKNGAVELYKTRRREHPSESHHAATIAVGLTMGVTNMTVRNWVDKAAAAELAAVQIVEAPSEHATPKGTALKAFIDVLNASEPDVEQAHESVAEHSAEDPQIVIMALRRELAEVKRANTILKSATAYLASEALKAA